MKKLLWIGDAACDSGFSNVTHSVLSFLHNSWDVSVLGVNYRGDPHNYPYRIYPAFVVGCRNFLGTSRVKDVLEAEKPDVVVLQTDPWNVPTYDALIGCGIPVIGIIPVDGRNCAGDQLNTLDRVIFWTHFGRNEAIKGGLKKPSTVIPLGVDTTIFVPGFQQAARQFLGLPQEMVDGFIVGCVNRNQPRKRFDLLIRYFCMWVKSHNIENAYLFLHIGPTGENGYDCVRLMKYYGIERRLFLALPEVWKGVPIPELVATYQAFDVQMTTTQGEGWGLTTMEGMACGIPQIVPDWAALGEWTEDAAWKISCPTTIATPGHANPIGGIADQYRCISALDRLYRLQDLRQEYGARGLALVNQERFRWWKIASQIEAELAIAYSSEDSHLPDLQVVGGTDA